ncbi:ferric reductase NAD binding domain-containing protein [Chytridium lagenaria]|nr:ferric reductase NAD binding domain-containing protein [Chytridium lagenaria]
MVNDGPTHLFLGLWILLNILLFTFTYIFYNTTSDYRMFRFYLGPTLGVARGAATCLNVACGVILVPVCRNLISLLRNTPLARIVPFDRSIDFHRILGFHDGILDFGACWGAYSQNLMVTPESLALLSGPGATGQLMSICLFLITTSSVSAVRRKQFEQFWMTHHLIIIFFALWMVHGNFCFIKADTPANACRGPNSWKYWVGFGSLYCVERVVRGLRARVPTKVWKVVQHPSGVVEVQMKKKWWSMRSGQYIFLNCPELSRYEWHPFTLTSAPEEDFLSVHIRVAGDWTTAFAKRLRCNWDDEKKGKKGGDAKEEEGEKKEEGPILGKAAESILPRVMVDGPYGAASEDVFNYQVSVCIGAGIGVTPFASVLKSIWYKIRNPTTDIPLIKVYFIWICREKDSFRWFQDLLQALEAEELDQYIDFRIYFTGRLKEEERSNIILNQTSTQDALTGLRSPTVYGRPNLDVLFKSLNESHPNSDVGVFFCGPKPLGNSIHAACNKFTSVDEDGTRFYYHKENF